MKYLVELCLPGDTVTPLSDMTLTLKADEEPEQDISEDISKFLIARLGFCKLYFVDCCRITWFFKFCQYYFNYDNISIKTCLQIITV